LCLTDSLVLGRQNMHCFEMEAGAILALHSLTASAPPPCAKSTK
jgi:hypothetical protein